MLVGKPSKRVVGVVLCLFLLFRSLFRLFLGLGNGLFALFGGLLSLSITLLKEIEGSVASFIEPAGFEFRFRLTHGHFTCSHMPVRAKPTSRR